MAIENKYGLAITEPEQVGMSVERLARIRPAMQRFIDSDQVPGLITAIARHGKVVHFETQGYTDPATIFRIYSMTKPITGVAVMMLYEEGRFFLDDPIADYLPEFQSMTVSTFDGIVEAERPITIRHLLTHTAGLSNGSTIFNSSPDVIQNESLRRLTGVTLEQHVKDVASFPLIAHPGTEWNYSQAMSVLARLVEVITGLGYGEFLREKIFYPLSMLDTDYYVPPKKAERMANLYVHDSNSRIISADISHYGGDYLQYPSLEAGGSGLAGTAQDYLRFAQMLLNGGELDSVRILSPTSVQLMMSGHLGRLFGETPLVSQQNAQFLKISSLEGNGLDFGFTGVVVDMLARGFAGSNGEFTWGGWANTDFWIDPKQDLIGLVFTQVIPTQVPLTTRARMHQMTYQAILD